MVSFTLPLHCSRERATIHQIQGWLGSRYSLNMTVKVYNKKRGGEGGGKLPLLGIKPIIKSGENSLYNYVTALLKKILW
jgi:hypothetical protein